MGAAPLIEAIRGLNPTSSRFLVVTGPNKQQYKDSGKFDCVVSIDITSLTSRLSGTDIDYKHYFYSVNSKIWFLHNLAYVQS